jgi:hypothetical protein
MGIWRATTLPMRGLHSRASSLISSPSRRNRRFSPSLSGAFFPKKTLHWLFGENLKVGVEGTIALVADSRQDVDWAKAGEAKGMNKEKWKVLVKAAKPHTKKILSFLGHKPAASTSTAKPEVK